MFRSTEDNNLLDAMLKLVHELEQAIARGEQLNNEIIVALSGLKMAEERTEKEIDKILKNMLHEVENSDKLDS